jgi:hypothetical protein
MIRMSSNSQFPKSVTLALWFIGLGLLLNAAVFAFKQPPGEFPDVLSAKAYGDAPVESRLGARGIYMMPGQLGSGIFGLYIMDIDAGNVAVYRVDTENSRFHLMSVRHFIDDCYLTDFNNGSPSPADVRKLVEQQRQRDAGKDKTESP